MLLHRAVASAVKKFSSERADFVQKLAVIRNQELELTAFNNDGPVLTVAIPRGSDVSAAQGWIDRWLALKITPRSESPDEGTS